MFELAGCFCCLKSNHTIWKHLHLTQQKKWMDVDVYFMHHVEVQDIQPVGPEPTNVQQHRIVWRRKDIDCFVCHGFTNKHTQSMNHDKIAHPLTATNPSPRTRCSGRCHKTRAGGATQLFRPHTLSGLSLGYTSRGDHSLYARRWHCNFRGGPVPRQRHHNDHDCEHGGGHPEQWIVTEAIRFGCGWWAHGRTRLWIGNTHGEGGKGRRDASRGLLPCQRHACVCLFT